MKKWLWCFLYVCIYPFVWAGLFAVWLFYKIMDTLSAIGKKIHERKA